MIDFLCACKIWFQSAVIPWLEANAVWLGALGALIALVAVFGKPLLALFGKKHSGTTINNYGVSLKEHESAVQRRLAELEAELKRAHGAERQLLEREIGETRNKLDNVEQSYQETLERIDRLQIELTELKSGIDPARLEAAIAALREANYSSADEIFAEIEAANDPNVIAVARAAFGRGEVAEAEIRWKDSAAHYARAARHNPSFENLNKAREFAWRAGDYASARRHGEDMLKIARNGADQQQLAKALNEHALTLGDLGHYAEAEALYRQALEIGAATIGVNHPDYATGLNNLALVLRAQGDYEEAETLYRQALEIGAATLGEHHPDYAIHLNNLAELLRAQGDYGEAEALYRQALEIDAATIGEHHPDYAIRLNNLAGVRRAQSDYGEAEALYRQALEIDAATIGEHHPDYAIDLNNLAGVLEAQGEYGEAEALYRQALEIFEQRLPPDHPHIVIVRENLEFCSKQ